MRVAVVTNTYPPHEITGVGTLVVELARRLEDTGHEAVVITRRAADDDPWAAPTGGGKLAFPLRAVAAILRAGRERPFDVVHLHESDGVFVALALRLLRMLRRPAGRARVVATLQVSYVRERRAVRPVVARTREGERVVSRPTASERRFARVRAPILALLGRLTARLADRVAAPSRQTARELEEDYGASDVEVIPNGVAPFPEVAAGAAPKAKTAGRPTVLYAGRLRTRKAVGVLLEAFARLLPEHPDAILVLVGDGEQRSTLEDRAARLGIAGSVRFEGAIPRDDMAGWYRAADLFCLPSLYEGLPLAILEAMAAALPVVATRVSGNPEAVADGETGLLVEPEDAAGLARALGALLSDPERARRMGEAGRRRMKGELGISAIAERYLELYRSVTGATRSPGPPAA